MKTHQIIFILAVTLFACSDDEASTGWRVTEGNADTQSYGDDNTHTVVTADGDTYVVTGSSDASGCVDIDGNCIDIADAQGRYCDDEGAQADIIIDENGNVIDVICYPPPDDGTPLEEITPDGEGNVTLEQNESGAVLTFDEASNGTPLEGDLKLEAERTTLYGNGIDETILNGNVEIESNNSRVRGLTIQGNVVFIKNSNNSALALCKIEGNLQIHSNGTTVASCEVFGNVQADGNDLNLVNVGVQGNWEVNDGATCNGCYSFSDESDDFIVDADEIGDPLQCSENN